MSDLQNINEALWRIVEIMECDIKDRSPKELIQNAKVKKLVECLKGLIDDLETPHRLGLGEPVNKHWTNYKKAKEALAEWSGGSNGI